jgi:putative DNA primase/helicase
MSQVQNGIPVTTHSPLLLNLLSRITHVNFKSLAGHDKQATDKRLTLKEVIVCVVDELIRIAEANNWGLCKMNGFIYVYTGEYWSLVETEEFKGFLGDAAWFMGLRKTDAKFYLFQDQLYLQFMASARLNIEVRQNETTIINLKNGTFEVSPQGIRLREFNMRDALTYQLPFRFDETAECPEFRAYLNRVLPDEGLQTILAEYIGYIFAKHLKLEKCLLLYGSGANGKSVFFDIVNAMLGQENISNFSLGNLGEEHNRALIADKLLNYGSEIKGTIEADTFKQLVSGESVQCRLKYGNSFTIKSYARLCFNCNELPKDVEHTEAYFRRFLIIPFNETIPEEERNPDLAKGIIASELSGVFNWVLQGLQRLLSQRRFSESELVTSAVQHYKQQSDSVFLFLEEGGYHKSAASATLLKYIFPQYRSFCSNNGLSPLGKPNFSRRLVNLGYNVARRNNGMVVNVAQTEMEQTY